ncbi:hypothetical protein SCLCIDRAFT_1099925 [Scleroderma citrinum Foug A]|uniref:Uncharacterized protein n=1 Tax=Scleroderma citrinum Foug A TaxID=1036808 RepID=A0A0C3DQG2_9AGAM|nr:hypothetical protein SCLCIDRAFT_1099925 [Scleroderma citrinum Foug A]
MAVSPLPRFGPAREWYEACIPTISVSLPTDGDMPCPAPSHLRAADRLSPRPRSPAYRSLYDVFVSTRSRLVQIRKASPVSLLSLVSTMNQEYALPVAPPLSVWTAIEAGADPDCCWLMFRTHDDALAFLSLSMSSITVLPALEVDLDPLDKLWRVDMGPKPGARNTIDHHPLRMSLSTPDLHRRTLAAQAPYNIPVTQTQDFVLSSNPPNPRTTFRLGDWICSSPSCAAHNFG